MTKEEYAILFGYWLRKQSTKVLRGQSTTEHLLQLFEYDSRLREKGTKNKANHTFLARKLRKRGYTIRGIAGILGYKHPGSVSHLLNKSL